MRESARSVQLLEDACREWIFRTFGREPWFPGDFCDHRFPSIEQRQPIDIVLFGDFLKQIIRSPSWFRNRTGNQYRLWTLSSAVREVCTELIGVPESAVGVIPRDQLFAKKRSDRGLPAPGKKYTLVYSGRLSQSKNFDLVIRVLSALQCELGQPAELVCLGHWDRWGTIEKRGDRFLRETRKLIEQLPWRAKPKFLGNLAADRWHRVRLENPVLFSLSSFFMEDFGVSIEQARSQGWPCILSEWGGHLDVTGENILKIPAHMLGCAAEPESFRAGRALAIARAIVSGMQSRPMRAGRDGGSPLIEPRSVLGIRDLDRIRGDFRRRFKSGAFESRGNRVAEWFSESAAGRDFYERYSRIFSGDSREKNGNRHRTVLASQFDEDFRWQSLNQILPALESAWAATASPERLIMPMDARELLIRMIPGISEAETIVFPFWTKPSAAIVRALRGPIGSDARIVIHTHGEGTSGAVHFEKISSFLKSSDVFMCASRAEARSMRRCFPNARIRVFPFPIPIRDERPHRGPSRLPGRPISYVYVGRISEQKNLHVLLLALWILKRNRTLRSPLLHVFGAPDGLGSPNMAMRSDDYGGFLRRLIRRLDLTKNVRWHGFVDRQRLDELTLNQNLVFVSASLHSDEDFGVAAYTYLRNGKRAVLSAWGGHLDLRRRFGKQVIPVRVHVSRWGPVLSPVELADAMAASQKGGPRFSPDAQKNDFSLECAAGQLVRLVEARSVPGGRLRSSKEVRELLRRRVGSKVYRGYEDPLAQPFFKAYGMTAGELGRTRGDGGPVPILAPWVSIGKEARINDPHHGTRKLALGATRGRDHSSAFIYDVSGKRYRIPENVISELIELGAAFQLSQPFS